MTNFIACYDSGHRVKTKLTLFVREHISISTRRLGICHFVLRSTIAYGRLLSKIAEGIFAFLNSTASNHQEAVSYMEIITDPWPRAVVFEGQD